jgi:hypothetical protein
MTDKPTICAECKHMRDIGDYLPPECKTPGWDVGPLDRYLCGIVMTTGGHMDFVTGEELPTHTFLPPCREKNNGHCPDFGAKEEPK